MREVPAAVRTRDFTGQFSRWKYEVLGYPFTPAGQRRWIADLLAYCDTHADIDAVCSWSPEWCGEGMWKGFALFEPDGEPTPAIRDTVAFFERQGLRVDLHPKPAATPLRFSATVE